MGAESLDPFANRAGDLTGRPKATLDDLLVELQAIRVLLEEERDRVAICPHGSTGICMHCLTPTLDQVVMTVGNTLRESLGRGGPSRSW